MKKETFTFTATNRTHSMPNIHILLFVLTLTSLPLGVAGKTHFPSLLLRTEDAPIITTQPTSAIVCPGAAFSLSVVATGTSLNYQLKKDGNDIAGANSATYSVASSSNADMGNYTVLVSDGTGIITSSTAVVSRAAVPVITTQPVGGNFTCGSTRDLSVVTQGDRLSYQWKKDNADIAGANAATYSTGATGNYKIMVSSACYATILTSDEVRLAANPVTITNPITGGSFICGSTEWYMEVGHSAGGTPISYVWKKNGVTIPGENQPYYSAKYATNYTLEVTNVCGATATTSAVVTTNPPIIQPIGPPNAGGVQLTNVCINPPLHFVVSVGWPFKYQWKNSDVPISGATDSIFTPWAYHTQSFYKCEITNVCGGTANSRYYVVENAALQYYTVTSTPVSRSYCYGDTIKLSPTVAVNGGTEYYKATPIYKWYKDGVQVGTSSSTPTISIPNATGTRVGNYTMSMSNACNALPAQAVAVVTRGVDLRGYELYF
jgi:hypothetical protein